jgi:hypothetical protein
MKRTTIMLPPELKERAQRTARERGISFGQLLRESLEETLRRDSKSGFAADPLFADTAVFEGDAPADLAASHDVYLYGAGGES